MLPCRCTAIYFITILQAFIYSVISDCPRDAEHKIQLCIKSSLPNFGLGPPVDASRPSAIQNSIEMSKDSCQTNKLSASAKCMQDFLDQCQGTTDREQSLQRLFDKEKIQQTVNYFCASLPIFEKHAKCISEQHQIAANCSFDEEIKFKTMMKAGATKDVLIQANCRFQRVATSCLDDIVFQNCGLEAAEFIETFNILMTPPICESKKQKYSSNISTSNKYDFYAVLTVLFIKLSNILQ